MILHRETRGEVTFLHLGTKKRGLVAVTEIDTEDLEKVLTRSWRAMWSVNAATFYVYASNPTTGLHRFIMNAPSGVQVDHIDGNPLNNKKENLRLCTHQQNMMNKRVYANNTTGEKGVLFEKTKNRWRAQVSFQNKKYRRYASSKEEAAVFAQELRKQLHKEFSR